MKYILILLFLSCSTTQYLGGKRHKFNARAQRVIWLQLAGWGSDLYPLIKFDGLDDKASLLESMDSLGRIWSYSAQNLRSSAAESFFYQMNAKAYIDKDCSDLEKLPLFQSLVQEDFTLGFFQASKVEGLSPQDSIDCKSSWALRGSSQLYFWRSFPGVQQKNPFHSERSIEFEPGLIYTDQSCSDKSCFKEKVENILVVYEKQMSKKKQSLFLIRDDSLLNVKKAKDLKEKLKEQIYLINYFSELTKNDPNLLLLVTGAEAIGLKYPKKGNKWRLLDQNGSFLKFDEPRLDSSVLAIGASSEIFSGLYREQDIYFKLKWAIDGL